MYELHKFDSSEVHSILFFRNKLRDRNGAAFIGRKLMKNFTKCINDSHGFTLLELLIAVTLLSIGLLAAASMQVTAINANSFANSHTISTTVAEQIMEDILSADVRIGGPWYVIFSTAGTYPYNRFPPAANATYYVSGAGTFTAQYTVLVNTPSINTSEVQLSVFLNGNRLPFTLVGHRALPATSL